ncbi:hypothetical protein BB559_000452 [Furculomyces boomerangus]|uniref:HTH APSES-type domain-containing protein n=1 Tax=Furculomyces boomerangus TaxID=61424 RepID=A0A2T9Z596_9FUNG|nr:hypothetical protein BB559_000452 [Furculomyces boomerangus]
MSESTKDQVWSASYAGVEVYQQLYNDTAVMRRISDSYVNITQVLKCAQYDKLHRTRFLEKEVHNGTHEKVQGGYGKYQGTWVPLEKAVELAKRLNVFNSLKNILEYDIKDQEKPPTAPCSLESMRDRKKRKQSIQTKGLQISPLYTNQSNTPNNTNATKNMSVRQPGLAPISQSILPRTTSSNSSVLYDGEMRPISSTKIPANAYSNQYPQNISNIHPSPLSLTRSVNVGSGGYEPRYPNILSDNSHRSNSHINSSANYQEAEGVPVYLKQSIKDGHSHSFNQKYAKNIPIFDSVNIYDSPKESVEMNQKMIDSTHENHQSKAMLKRKSGSEFSVDASKRILSDDKKLELQGKTKSLKSGKDNINNTFDSPNYENEEVYNSNYSSLIGKGPYRNDTTTPKKQILKNSDSYVDNEPKTIPINGKTNRLSSIGNNNNSQGLPALVAAAEIHLTAKNSKDEIMENLKNVNQNSNKTTVSSNSETIPNFKDNSQTNANIKQNFKEIIPQPQNGKHDNSSPSDFVFTHPKVYPKPSPLTHGTSLKSGIIKPRLPNFEPIPQNRATIVSEPSKIQKPSQSMPANFEANMQLNNSKNSSSGSTNSINTTAMNFVKLRTFLTNNEGSKPNNNTYNHISRSQEWADNSPETLLPPDLEAFVRTDNTYLPGTALGPGKMTTIHYAVRTGHMQTIQILLSRGFHTEATRDGRTPLMLAASSFICWKVRHRNVFPQILDLFNNTIMKRDKNGQTLVHYIASGPVLDYNVIKRNSDNKTPSDSSGPFALNKHLLIKSGSIDLSKKSNSLLIRSSSVCNPSSLKAFPDLNTTQNDKNLNEDSNSQERNSTEKRSSLVPNDKDDLKACKAEASLYYMKCLIRHLRKTNQLEILQWRDYKEKLALDIAENTELNGTSELLKDQSLVLDESQAVGFGGSENSFIDSYNPISSEMDRNNHFESTKPSSYKAVVEKDYGSLLTKKPSMDENFSDISTEDENEIPNQPQPNLSVKEKSYPKNHRNRNIGSSDDTHSESDDTPLMYRPNKIYQPIYNRDDITLRTNNPNDKNTIDSNGFENEYRLNRDLSSEPETVHLDSSDQENTTSNIHNKRTSTEILNLNKKARVSFDPHNNHSPNLDYSNHEKIATAHINTNPVKTRGRPRKHRPQTGVAGNNDHYPSKDHFPVNNSQQITNEPLNTERVSKDKRKNNNIDSDYKYSENQPSNLTPPVRRKGEGEDLNMVHQNQNYSSDIQNAQKTTIGLQRSSDSNVPLLYRMEAQMASSAQKRLVYPKLGEFPSSHSISNFSEPRKPSKGLSGSLNTPPHMNRSVESVLKNQRLVSSNQHFKPNSQVNGLQRHIDSETTTHDKPTAYNFEKNDFQESPSLKIKNHKKSGFSNTSQNLKLSSAIREFAAQSHNNDKTYHNSGKNAEHSEGRQDPDVFKYKEAIKSVEKVISSHLSQFTIDQHNPVSDIISDGKNRTFTPPNSKDTNSEMDTQASSGQTFIPHLLGDLYNRLCVEESLLVKEISKKIVQKQIVSSFNDLAFRLAKNSNIDIKNITTNNSGIFDNETINTNVDMQTKDINNGQDNLVVEHKNATHFLENNSVDTSSTKKTSMLEPETSTNITNDTQIHKDSIDKSQPSESHSNSNLLDDSNSEKQRDILLKKLSTQISDTKSLIEELVKLV